MIKEKMYSRMSNTLLHDHIIDGFSASHEGLRQLKEKGLITQQEYIDLLEKNVKRLVERVRDFRIAEKITCIAFAFVFTWMQATGEEIDMRRTRTRAGRSGYMRKQANAV